MASEAKQTEFPYKNSLVRVSLRLDLPEDRIKRVLEEDCFLAPNHPEYHAAAMRTVEEYCRDHFADLLDCLAGEPEFEADA